MRRCRAFDASFTWLAGAIGALGKNVVANRYTRRLRKNDIFVYPEHVSQAKLCLLWALRSTSITKQALRATLCVIPRSRSQASAVSCANAETVAGLLRTAENTPSEPHNCAAKCGPQWHTEPMIEA